MDCLQSSGQDIYLEDTALNVTHDLRASPYTFTTDAGVFNTRFILKFNANALSITDTNILANLVIKKINKTIDVSSLLSTIESFELFDITGRVIHKTSNINNTDYSYDINSLSNGPYIVKVSLSNGGVKTKKLIL